MKNTKSQCRGGPLPFHTSSKIIKGGSIGAQPQPMGHNSVVYRIQVGLSIEDFYVYHAPMGSGRFPEDRFPDDSVIFIDDNGHYTFLPIRLHNAVVNSYIDTYGRNPERIADI